MGSKSVVVAGAGGNIGSHLMESVAVWLRWGAWF